ncbi:MAG: hypothetical protein IKI11_09305 [Neisseriaceae bacterium]|nr:hypothetical protein [Neisseriaceae bacterium]
MTLKEMIQRCRIESNDTAEPYFVSDDAYKIWLNDALVEACIRGRLLYEKDDYAKCFMFFAAGEKAVDLSHDWVEIEEVGIVVSHNHFLRLPLLSPDAVIAQYGEDYQSHDNLPVCAIMEDTKLRLFPTQSQDLTIKVQGYRLAEPLENDDDEPEIHATHHRHLCDYALMKAFSVPDAELFDPNRAALAQKAFDDYFGLPKDSDFRRITREDRPHTVKAFWV